MALAGAIGVLEWLHRQWHRAAVTYVSDSTYVVQGMSEWIHAWKARGWKRKGGEIQNLAHRERVDGLGFGRPGVAPDPFPSHVVPRRGLIQALPQRQGLAPPRFSPPAPGFPCVGSP